jgi:hypothetical protein
VSLTAGCHIRGKAASVEYDQVDDCTDYCRRPKATIIGSSMANNDLSLSSIHMKIRLGYDGSFSRPKRHIHPPRKMRMFPYRRYKTVRQVAYEREHAVVHVINRYRARVDMALREQHGNLYEWEIMADCESIAQ